MRKALIIGILSSIFIFIGCTSVTRELEKDFEISTGTFGINIMEDMELDFDEENTIEIILDELQAHARIQGIDDDIRYDDIRIFLWNLVIGGVNGVIEANIAEYNERNGFPRRMEVLSEDNIWYDLIISTRSINIRVDEQRIWYSIMHIRNMETGDSVMYEW